MKKGKYIWTLGLTFLLLSCNSSELVENWKNPEITTFEAEKSSCLSNDE